MLVAADCLVFVGCLLSVVFCCLLIVVRSSLFVLLVVCRLRVCVVVCCCVLSFDVVWGCLLCVVCWLLPFVSCLLRVVT